MTFSPGFGINRTWYAPTPGEEGHLVVGLCIEAAEYLDSFLQRARAPTQQ